MLGAVTGGDALARSVVVIGKEMKDAGHATDALGAVSRSDFTARRRRTHRFHVSHRRLVSLSLFVSSELRGREGKEGASRGSWLLC